MNAVATSKSRLLNWFEGVTLIGILQGLPVYASAALMLRMFDRDLVRPDRSFILLIVIAIFIYAIATSLLGGSRAPKILRNGYEPIFFDPTLSLTDKIARWRTQPRASVQLLASVLMLSVLAVAVLSIG
jgi:hypothetical protein